MILGGIEFETKTSVEHLLNDRRCRLDALLERVPEDDPHRAEALKSLYMNDLFWFLPHEQKQFCSCLLFENLMRELVMSGTYPTLPDVVEQYPSSSDDARLLVRQLEEWPARRSEHYSSPAPRPRYWRLLGHAAPLTVQWQMVPTPTTRDEAAIRRLLALEEDMQPALQEVETALAATMEKIDGL